MSDSIPDRIRALLEETVPFAWLEPEEREDMLSDVTVEFFEAGDVVLEQFGTVTKGLYIIETGLVRLMDIDQRRLLEKCVRGDTFGSYGLLRGGPRIYQAKALEGTVCAVLDGKRFKQVCDSHQEFVNFFERDINQYIRRLDSSLDITGSHLLFSQALSGFPLRAPLTVQATMPVREVARQMTQDGSEAVIVKRHGKLAGILTDRDIRERLVAAGRSLDTPASKVMTAPPATIDHESTLFDAMMAMLQGRVGCLVVTEPGQDGPAPVAMLSDRALMHFRGMDPVATVQEMDAIQSTDDLTNVRSEINDQLLRLYQQRVSPELLGRISAAIYDRIVIRVLELAESELKRDREAQKRRVDVPWAWLRLGSGGRKEMALNSAQHNAIIFEDPESEEDRERARLWFGSLANRANEALERCGFEASPLIARNPEWCRSFSEWKSRIRRWIRRADAELPPEAALTFDVRWVYGDRALVDRLKSEMLDSLTVESTAPAFVRDMAAAVLSQSPSPSIFRRLMLEHFGSQRHRFNVKDRGIVPVVGMARVLAIELRYMTSSNTFDRLRHAAEVLAAVGPTAMSVLDAYQYLADFRLENQLRAVEAGEAPTDELDLTSLSQYQRDLLYNAIDKIGQLHTLLEKRYGVK